MPSQTFDDMLRNRVYIGQVDVADYGVSIRGDFELVSEKIFFRSRLSGYDHLVIGGAASRTQHRNLTSDTARTLRRASRR